MEVLDMMNISWAPLPGLRLELSALQGLDLGVDPHLAQLLLNDHGGVRITWVSEHQRVVEKPSG